ncbi:MAG: glycosyltransferase family 2 protein [bacterium]
MSVVPEISVLIVCHNSGAERLARCLKGLEEQSFKDFEVLILDNHSYDGSIDALPARPWLRVIQLADNLGFAGGMNKAANAAKGKWLALLNPDTRPQRDWLLELHKASRAWPQDQLFSSVQLSLADPTKLDGLGDVFHASGLVWRGDFHQPASHIPQQDCEVFSASGAALMIARDLFQRLGGFAHEYFCYVEDIDLGFRYRLRGGRAILVANAIIHHEGSGTTGQYSDFTIYHGVRNRYRTFVRCMPGALFWLLWPVHMLINFLFLIRSFLSGTGKAYWRGLQDGMFASPHLWTQRQDIQAQRTVSLWRVARSFCWSPVKLLRRGADLRQPTRPASQQD